MIIIEKAIKYYICGISALCRDVVHPYSIAILDDKVYWTDFSTNDLHYATTWTAGSRGVLLKTNSKLMGLLKVDRHQQNTGVNALKSI